MRGFRDYAFDAVFPAVLPPLFFPAPRAFLRNRLRPGSLGNPVPVTSFQRPDALPPADLSAAAEAAHRAERRYPAGSILRPVRDRPGHWLVYRSLPRAAAWKRDCPSEAP